MRVALIGAGWIARDHLDALAKRPDVEVAAVCDVDRGRAEQLAPAGAEVHTDWRELLDADELGAVWVCVPPLAHREVATGALERGLHVYLEKPIARTPEDAAAIVDAAAAADAVCAIGYQWHATEVLDDLRAELDGQQIALLVGHSIGPTGSRSWFLDRRQGGGNVLERGSHQIDLVRTVAGEVERVQAAGSRVLLGQAEGERGDIEDAATLILHLAGGGVATIVVAWTREGQPRRYDLDVVAEDATLSLTLDPEFSLRGVSRGRTVDARSGEHPFERSIGRFLDACRANDKSRVFCTPADAARTLAVARACEQALATGETVTL
ncbi:MAG TPA: Gfo/Idh/MocA family oxidoreductase [Gaiellaceae bacterium]|nr:Gfo/Idh/MocA family oxidoreductase [Gaiellaceae bacterium]